MEDAAEVIAEIEQRLSEGEERLAAVYLPLARAALERARGDDAAAESTHRHGIVLQERLAARWPQLRTATALAGLLRDHERPAARSSTTPIRMVDALEWFVCEVYVERMSPIDSSSGIGVASVSHTATEVTLRFADGSDVRCNRFWLRDNCPMDGERASLFRSFSVAEMADDVAIVDSALVGDRVRVSFGDGMTDDFDPAWLRRHNAPATESDGCAPWQVGFEPELFGVDELEHESGRHHDLLEAVARSGCALVTGLPDGVATERLAALLGPIRETDFGRVFDIVTEPQPFTPSQSAVALDPHTDDPYRYTPSGVSILHCVMPSDGNGGESMIVDGLAVAESIRRDDPEAFELLSTVAVPFVHRRAEAVEQGGDVYLRAEAPIIAVDASGRVCGIRFHERSMATQTLDADLAERFYPALMRFSRAVLDDRFTWRRHLVAGEAVVYDNQRVLHARSGFEGAQTRRHLRLCTVDRDQVHSRLRRLRECYAPGTENALLPAGNLS